MPKPSLRDAILDAGLKEMFRTGYHGTSVRDVTAAAGAPQGSFTNHFRSKELFASEVLDRYFLYVRGLGAEALSDTSLPPRDRLRRYLDLITGKLAHDGFTRGCLIGDFSLEASGSSEMTTLTTSSWSLSVRRHAHVSVSHTLSVEPPDETTRPPHTASAWIASPWSLSARSHCPLSTSHTRIEPSHEPV